MSELASPARCLNCTAVLVGPYCHRCGQKGRNIIRFFDEVLREILNNNLGYDSRLWRTIRLLLLKPGDLARQYVDGKRISFVSPIRMYLVTSLVFILFEQLSAEPVSWVIATSLSRLAFSDTAAETDGNIGFLQESYFSGLTLMMLPVLPLMALVLKALFWKQRPLYMEHLVFMLYSQAALFLLFLCLRMAPLWLVRTLLDDAAAAAVIDTLLLVVTLSLGYAYGVMSVKHFYSAAWLPAVTKHLCAIVAYFLLNGLGLLLAFLWLTRSG